MATFTREITINAPVVRVWEALGDIGSISRWNPQHFPLEPWGGAVLCHDR